MTKGTLTKAEFEKWPPDSLTQYIFEALKDKSDLGLSPLSAADVKVLTRFTDPEDTELRLVYRALIASTKEKNAHSKVAKYLEQVCECYLDLEMYQPLSVKEYNDWLRTLSRLSNKLVDSLQSVPSPDVTVPATLQNLGALLREVLVGYGDEMALEQYDAARPQLKRALRSISSAMAINTLGALSRAELSKLPKQYWEKELGIVAPRKHGTKGARAKETILVKAIKRLTIAVFKKPHHDIVATLVNTLLAKEKYSADSISKVPL